ncbi:hypothetical protein [uncultured Cohaesibacter sp.]|uniref:hypothetical protein n=1 Tax=uncultured Cohaesibacter sp. TaxID=1002546 RepID=UPI0029C8C772|nr:hypothetical protein [uncultured Cohaesibacter sp.]
MRALRKDSLAVCVTLIALTCQLFFGVVHATSVWTAAAGDVAKVQKGSTAYSFLQICSAGGLIILDDESGSNNAPEKGVNPDNCPVCASAAIAPMLDGSPPILAAIEPASFPAAVQPYDQVLVVLALHRIYARGPPAFS